MLHQRDWQGLWLGYPAAWAGKALYFRRPFEIVKPVAQGRVYVAGIGCHELRLNGAKVGDAVLEPAQTCYDHRVLYVTHDVTARLRRGKNVIGVIVGNGWYGTCRLLLELHIRHTDGSEMKIVTEPGSFTWTVGTGPVVHHGIYDGETYDARLADDGWDTPAYSASFAHGGGHDKRRRNMTWIPVQAATPPGGVLAAQNVEPMRVVQTRLPKVLRPKPRHYVLDMRQNMAGWVRLRVRARRGTAISLRFAETLRKDGTVNQDNLTVARTPDTYIARGGGVELWEPRFTYHGFRYVQVEGLSRPPRPADFAGRVVRTHTPVRGEFDCDNPLLRRIHKAIVWTEAGNQHGLPTDCPQRAERMGWLNDLTARAEMAVMNFDVSRLYAKFAKDIADAQAHDGALADTAPHRWGFYPCDPVCIALLNLPLLVYAHWGDDVPLRTHYDAMSRWVSCLQARSEGGLLRLSRWGDWSEPSGSPTTLLPPNSRRTPGELVSTAFLYHHANLLARAAAIVGRRSDVRKHQALAAGVRLAFNRRFWNERRGVYGTGSQACNALAVALGLANPAQAQQALKALADDIIAAGYHLSTGNIATKYALEALSENGYHEVACRVAASRTYPSWGFMLSKGATTIWERWEHATGDSMNSHNHPMLASVGSWFYKHLAGLRLHPQAVGSDRLLIAPAPAAGLSRAQARLQTPLGEASVAWRASRGEMLADVTVPCGASASVLLPPGEASESGAVLAGGRLPPGIRRVVVAGGAVRADIQSGDYRFSVRLANPLTPAAARQ
jgi:alpha-L-rhamnosidase